MINIATPDGPREVDGEHVAPGIAITPHTSLYGWWHLTHVPSGMAFTKLGALEDVDQLRQAGEAIGAGDVDWDQDLDDIRGTDTSHTAGIIGDLYEL